MAKYGKKAQEKVERSMHEFKHGKLKSGRSGKKVKSKQQAIAIGLSQAREMGAKVPTAPKKTTTKRETATKTSKTTRRTSNDKRSESTKKGTKSKSLLANLFSR